jgi:hypothetical protein
MVMDVSETLAQRGGRYGAFIEHAKIAQDIQDAMRSAPNWDKLDVDMRQALSVIADKIARILNGDPYYDDSWHDISGYATLVEKRIKELNERNTKAVPSSNSSDERSSKEPTRLSDAEVRDYYTRFDISPLPYV